MGTLIEWLADAVVHGSKSANKIFDVRGLPCGALRSTDSDPIIRESMMASLAIGAARFRDDAMLATSR